MARLFIIVTVFGTLLILTGCKDKQIDAFEDQKGIYSVYGAMDLHSPQNVIRVRDLSTFHDDTSSIHLDATVTFTDLANGTSIVLEDSVVQFPANFTHNFILNKNLEPSSPYRVDVERSDGLNVSSMFTTPGVTKTEVISASDSINCHTQIKFVFKNVEPDEQIRIEFGVSYNNEMYWLEFSRICITEYFEDRKELVITAKPYLLLDFIWPKPKMDPPPNCRDPRFPTVLCGDLDSSDIIIRYLHLGPDWKKVYPVRPRMPDHVGDVENGLGFLGAFRRDSLLVKVITD